MDAFYASVEQRDNPALRGKPVAVGGERMRGVVATASYEARKFGIHSAMPSITAKHKCPDLIFVKPRFDAYKAVSRQIREIFARYTPLIEPLSLDEAYLDVTENLREIATATAIAEEIRAAIKAETGLTASAGVSYNKFLAKIASDYRKPDGLFVITPKMGPAFVAALPVRKFFGIGPATAAKMHGRPIVLAVAGIADDALLLRKPDQDRKETGIVARAVHDRWNPYDRRAHALLGETEHSRFDNVANSQGALERLAAREGGILLGGWTAEMFPTRRADAPRRDQRLSGPLQSLTVCEHDLLLRGSHRVEASGGKQVLPVRDVDDAVGVCGRRF
jgi:nucleotidyltransferase/DNA polymerase involved in DNA repair